MRRAALSEAEGFASRFSLSFQHQAPKPNFQRALIKCYIRYIPNSSWMLPR